MFKDLNGVFQLSAQVSTAMLTANIVPDPEAHYGKLTVVRPLQLSSRAKALLLVHSKHFKGTDRLSEQLPCLSASGCNADHLSRIICRFPQSFLAFSVIRLLLSYQTSSSSLTMTLSRRTLGCVNPHRL